MVYDMARQLGMVDAFGTTRDGKLGLWQVIARVIDQGSRLSAVRLAGSHAVCNVIGLLCNEAGVPLSVEVFTGNTQDPRTFAPQIKKVAERFGS
jgi:hypothetical protein